ncbi:MAG: hypothetical protein LBR60_02625, partial [Fibrobacter sp.]|nr:hypothetical protein [Fibrobacter sp.]
FSLILIFACSDNGSSANGNTEKPGNSGATPPKKGSCYIISGYNNDIYCNAPLSEETCELNNMGNTATYMPDGCPSEGITKVCEKALFTVYYYNEDAVCD